MRSEKVYIISQYFYPDLAATGQVLTELAEELQSYGRTIRVVAGLPNYVGSDIVEAAKHENYRGIKIKRLNYLRLSKDSAVGRLAAWFSFWINAFINTVFIRDIQSVLIISNPPILPLLGVLLKRLRKCNFCFLMHDIYPDIAIQIGKLKQDSIMAKIMNAATTVALREANRVIALGNDAKKRLISKGVSPQNIIVIPNWADQTKISPGPKENDFACQYNLEDKFVLLYSGNIGLYYNLEYLVVAAERLQDVENLVLLFVGEGGKKAKLMELVSSRNLKNVKFIPYQPWDKYNLVLNSADILMVTLQEGVEGISVPSKMYSYMASGKPVAGMISYKSDVGRLIEEANCGFRVDPGDVDGFCKEIRRLYNDEKERTRLGKNALEAFLASYERKQVTRKFLDIL